jgi:RNA polymerase sigma factor (sigma-70 family)
MAGEWPQAAGLPPVLARLLSGADGAQREAAWAEFVAVYTGLLLHTCHSVARDHDGAMDGYVWVLEALREHDCRRLRGYTPVPGVNFTTWLVVVTRRSLLDQRRQRYGRSRSEDETRRAEQDVRRRLEDLVIAELDIDRVPTDSVADSPDLGIRRQELTGALRRSLEELPAAERLLLALRFEDDRSIREIAAMLGLPTVFHVYRQLNAALSVLRRALLRQGVEEPNP